MGMASFARPTLCPLALVKNSKTIASAPVLRFNTCIICSSTDAADSGEPNGLDPVKLAFARANAYKKSSLLNSSSSAVQTAIPEPSSNAKPQFDVPQDDELKTLERFSGKERRGTANTSQVDDKNEELESNGEPPSAVKIAFEKAKGYAKNKGLVGDTGAPGDGTSASGTKPKVKKTQGDGQSNKVGSKQELSVSSLDFLGLNFSDKKATRGLPAGLVPLEDNFSEGELPDVEIIVGDINKFGDASTSSAQPSVEANNAVLYKPKVTTWGVFPRPSNISKTYGGGRNIRPGDALESKEERDAKDAHTRQLLADYGNRIGLNVDKKLRSESEEAFKRGEFLMDLGKLKEALTFYEEVMQKMPFKTELHGLAALQWSICQDSLSRPNEARAMYDKLQSHPSFKVSKRARQFFFGFQAMDMMKVSSSGSPKIGYENYFDAFVEDKTSYLETDDDTEVSSSPTIPYILFLLSPIILILLMAAASKLH